MNWPTAVRITYWTEQSGPNSHEDLAGISEFKSDLETEYVSLVRGRPGDLGGLYDLAVEFVASITLQDFARFVAAGAAYDAIKSGAKSFLLRPFLQAYHKLLEKNSERTPHIDVLEIAFQDTTVTIREIYPGSLAPNLRVILERLAGSYTNLRLASGENPVHIYIPVFEDPAVDRLVQYREPLEVDETYRPVSDGDYLRLWGAEYAFARQWRVFDVEKELLLNAEFYTRDMYDARWAAEYARSIQLPTSS